MDLRPLYETWGRQGEGFVFISEKSPSGWKDHKAFKWPADKRKVGALVESRINGKPESGTGRKASGVTGAKTSAGVDLYWCPLVFSGPRRDIQLSNGGNCLYADLDPVDPRSLEVRPTIAWESSPGRYQALWWIDQMLEPSEFERINKGLTYHLGADKSGWDLTQVLRIPGTSNHKTNPPKSGKLLWMEQHVFNTASIPLSDDTRGPSKSRSITLVGLLSKYRKKFPTKVSQLLQYPDSRVTPGKRSEMLWYIESELVKAQIPMEDIIQMVRLSAWNKYKGRRDEEKRLTTEIQKVYDESQSDGPTKDDPAEDEDEDEDTPTKKSKFMTLGRLLGKPRFETPWLVKGIWHKGSSGVIAGEPKTFKSTLALDLAISVASGKKFLGEFEVMEPGPVIVIQNENAEWVMSSRAEMMMSAKGMVGEVTWPNITFAEEPPIHFLNNSGYTFDDPQDRETLEEKIKEVHPVLIIFDPLYLMFEGDINSAQELQSLLRYLMYLTDQYKASVMVIHHNKKGGTNARGGQNMLGSTTLHGWVESALYLTTTGEDVMEGAPVKITVGREFRGDGNHSKLDIGISIDTKDKDDLKYFVTVEAAASKAGNTNDLLDLLSMYPNGISQTQAAKELGISRGRLTSMMERSDVKPKIIISPGERGAKNLKLRSEVND